MFTRQTDRLADAVRLLSAMAAFAHKPDVKGGLSLYDAAKKVAAEPPPSLKTLADDLTRSARETLQRYPDAPADAETLYEQMVVQALLTDAEIVAENLDPARCTVAMQAKLTDREHKTGEMPRLFAAITEPALGPLLKTTEYTADLTPAYRRRVLEVLENVAEKLDNLGAQTRDTLIVIAMKFGDPDADDRSDPDLRAFLIEKAKDYRALSAQVASIDERTAGLGNLKAAAKDAIARADLEEVENLLSKVLETELEIAAETAELRADNALLRGRAEDAFRFLSSAAASFDTISRREAYTRRRRYFELLWRYGLRYGGAGLSCAVALAKRNLTELDEATSPSEWAAVQNDLAVALREQGRRTGGEAGAGLLAEAVDAYRAALRVTTEADRPTNWATTQNNLGNALAEQGSRTGGEAGARLLAEAVEAYCAALRVRTETEHPEDWAMTQNNLGITLRAQGSRTGGAAGARLLAEAVEAYRAALRVRTETEHPVGWATTQNNIGAALGQQSRLTGGEAGARLLAEAVAAFRAALRVTTAAEHPVDWAMTQNNLGAALAHRGQRIGGEEGARVLAEAVAAYRAALRVTTEAERPVDWAETMANLGLAHEAIAENKTCADPRAELTRAAECVEAALRIFDPEHMSYDFQKATAVLERIRNSLADLT